MTMRLALVIDGESKGALKAIEDTSSALSGLKSEAAAAVKPTGELADKTGSLADEATKAAPALGKAAAALVPIGERSAKAAKGIDLTGSAARRAVGGLSGFGSALGAVATGLVAGGLIAGFTLVADQTIRWVGAILDNSEEIKADLEAHDGLIGRIAKKYRDAAIGASDFGRESAAGLRFEAQQNVRRLDPRAREAATAAASGLSGDLGLFDLEEDFGPLEDAVGKFREEVARGAGDVNAFRKEVASIAGDLPDDSPFRVVAEGIAKTTDEASKLQSELGQAQAALKGLEGDSEAASMALGKLPKVFEDAGAAAERRAKSLALFRGELEALSSGASGGLSAPAESTGSVPAVPFASGGIVTRPTMFRFGASQLGIMGEAGPEAILPMSGDQIGAISNDNSESSLPLARLASGNLGVRMPKAFAAGGVIGGPRVSRFATGGIVSAPAVSGTGSAGGSSGGILGLADDLMVLDGALGNSTGGLRIFEAAGTNVSKSLRGQWTTNLQGAIGQLQGFTGTLGNESDKWEKINKAAGIANALISTYTGAAKALELGPIIGPPLAALTVATGLAYVAQIASGGSGSGGASGGASAPTVSSTSAPQQAQQQGTSSTFNIRLVGDRFSGEDVEELFTKINDGLADGHRLEASR